MIISVILNAFSGFTNIVWSWIIIKLSKVLGLEVTDEAAAKILAGFVVFILPFMVRRIHRILTTRSGIYRAISDNRQKLSGWWVEEIIKNNVRFYTLVEFRFDKRSMDYAINGVAYDERNLAHAIFYGYNLPKRLSEGRYMEYLFAGTYTRTGRTVKGYCYWALHTQLRDGAGHIVDFELDQDEGVTRQTLRLSFECKLLTRRAIHKITGKFHIRDDRDRLAIVEYIRNRGGLSNAGL